MENLKIITKEGKEIEISKEAAKLSEVLKGAMAEYPNEHIIPLNEIDEKSAEKIKEYLTHLNGVAPPEIAKPITSNDMKSITDEWSFEFIDKMSLEEIVNLTVAANYLGINCLLDLCCAKVATLCKDKPENEIFENFGIKEVFTEEERKKIKEENKWIEENL